MEKNYDLVVLGSGPGGYVAALKAAELGLSVCLVEKENIGGVCLNWGCIPTKTMLQTAHYFHKLKQAYDFAVTLDQNAIKVDIDALQARKQSIIEKLKKGIEFLLKKRKVEIVFGRGRFIDKNTVDVQGRTIGFNKCIIATGSYAAELKDIKFDEKKGIVSNREILSFSDVPESLLIIGGGVVGCEFADVYSCLGSRVKIVELDKNILPYEDSEVSRYLAADFSKRGIEIFTNTSVVSIVKQNDPDKLLVELAGGKYLPADKILLSVGRLPNVNDLGLENIGVEVQKKGIAVNEKMQTSVDNIYAIGDVVGYYSLAHVASHQAVVAAENIAGKGSSMSYDSIVRCVYTMPEVAAVGLTEKQADEQGLQIKIGKFSFSSSGKAVIENAGTGLVKIIARKDDDKLLGASVCGAMATEIIQEIAVAMKAGLKASELGSVIHAHPTLSESIMEAALDVNAQAIHIIR